MNLFDMTRDDWILFGIVIVTLAIPSLIKPASDWLGKKLHLVKQEPVEGENQSTPGDVNATTTEKNEEKTSEISTSSDSSSTKDGDGITG